jgi:predicted enzyme related to lactoylglutathione lyase
VADLEAGLAFYGRSLGHQIAWRSETAAGLRLLDTDAELVIHVEERPPAAELLVDAVPEAVERFVDAGGAVVAGPFEIAIGLCAVVRDPWGNTLTVLDMSKGPLQVDGDGRVVS